MDRKIRLIIAIVLTMSSCGQAISPFFSSNFYGLQNTIERFSYCRAYPMTSGNTTAPDHLIQAINSFLKLANFSPESLENFKEFMRQISVGEQFLVESDLALYIKTLDKNGRCDLLENVIDRMYPVLRRSAYNRSSTLNLTGLEMETPTNSRVKVNVTEHINALWISSNFTLDEMQHIGSEVVRYATELQQTMYPSSAEPSTKRAQSGAESACCSYSDWLSYYMDTLVGMVTRIRLGLSTRTLESRRFISDGLSFSRRESVDATSSNKKSKRAH